MNSLSSFDEDFEAFIDEYTTPARIENARREKEGAIAEMTRQSRRHLLRNPEKLDIEEVDLHRLTAEEAKRKVNDFILQSAMRGYRLIRVITGKGLHSENGKGVIRQAIHNELVRLQKQGRIKSYQWEKNNDVRMSGAAVVFLK